MAIAASTSLADDVGNGDYIPVGAPLHNEVTQFLYEEALLLDRRDFDGWAALLAQDLRYTAPLRVTRTGRLRNDDVIRSGGHFDDNYRSMMGRLGRLSTHSAWAEDPPSRTRRLITNILVRATPRDDEFAVISYVLLKRSRYDDPNYREISAERRDLLRRSGQGKWLIAQREIIIDQTLVGMSNFAIFL